MKVADEVSDRVRRRFRDELADDGTPRELLASLVADEIPLLDGVSADEFVGRLHAEMVGLGRLEVLWNSADVTDILINGPGEVWVERAGQLEPSGLTLDLASIMSVIERVLGPLGLRADRSMPIADGRLADGSRLSVVLPPLAIDGPFVSIRRFAARTIPLDELAGPAVARVLREAIAERANIVVFGGTGSGKTTLLNALCALLDPTERIVTVEDAAELRLPLPHVVRLEARPANGEGVGRVSVRDLIRAALRLRPDRIIVGEVRGPEAFDMVWAMSTGHDGSLSTCHASSAAEALARLETFTAMADASLPFSVASRQVRAAVDVLVGIQRRPDGARKVVSVHRVVQRDDTDDGLTPVWGPVAACRHAPPIDGPLA